MTSAEFAEWLAWDRVGGVVDPNLAQAHVSQTIAGAWGGSKAKLEEFLLLARESEATAQLTPEQTAGVLGRMAAARAQGGKAL